MLVGSWIYVFFNQAMLVSAFILFIYFFLSFTLAHLFCVIVKDLSPSSCHNMVAAAPEILTMTSGQHFE